MSGPEPEPQLSGKAKLQALAKQRAEEAKYPRKAYKMKHRARTDAAEEMLRAWNIADKSGDALQDVITLLKNPILGKSTTPGQKRAYIDARMDSIRKDANQRLADATPYKAKPIVRQRSESTGKRSLNEDASEPSEPHPSRAQNEVKSSSVPRSKKEAVELRTRSVSSSPFDLTGEDPPPMSEVAQRI